MIRSPAQQMKAAELLPVQKLTKCCTRTSHLLNHLVRKTLYVKAYLTNQRSDPDPATAAFPLPKQNKLQAYKQTTTSAENKRPFVILSTCLEKQLAVQ